MMKKLVGYLKANAEAEKLERRSSKEWEAIGTQEEVVTMVKYQERKTRNTAIVYAIYGATYLGIKLKNKQQKRKQEKLKQIMDLYDLYKVLGGADEMINYFKQVTEDEELMAFLIEGKILEREK